MAVCLDRDVEAKLIATRQTAAGVDQDGFGAAHRQADFRGSFLAHAAQA